MATASMTNHQCHLFPDLSCSCVSTSRDRQYVLDLRDSRPSRSPERLPICTTTIRPYLRSLAGRRGACETTTTSSPAALSDLTHYSQIRSATVAPDRSVPGMSASSPVVMLAHLRESNRSNAIRSAWNPTLCGNLGVLTMTGFCSDRRYQAGLGRRCAWT